MKYRKSLRVITCLLFLLAGGNASAIIEPCSVTGYATFSPGHPGPTDRIGYTVSVYLGLFPGARPTVTYTKAVVSGNTINIDAIVSNTALDLPGYQLVPPYDAGYTMGFIGPLSTGDYTIASTVHWYDAQLGLTVLACPSRVTPLAVTAQPGEIAAGLVVEFYNSTLDHYFLTQYQSEVNLLDAETSWKRTGQRFIAYLPGQSDRRGRPVARYYGLPSAGLDSHFFTWNESQAVEFGAYSAAWVLETRNAFEIPIPDWPTGICPINTIPVYRLWNGRADSAHRYTTDFSTRQQMISQGYVPEGYGPEAVVMCALSLTTLSITKSQSPSGSTLLTLSGDDGNGCIVFDETISAASSNIISVHTRYHIPGCLGVPPPGFANITTDVGNLAPGHYIVTWGTAGQQARTEIDVP